jgi:hypothetical protein
MKSLRALCVVILAVFSSGQVLAQTEHVITLYVNTSDIQNPNLNDYCDFGQDEGISNEDYTIEVSVGDTIVWVGQSNSNDNDQVLIESINHQGDQGGRDIFGQNVLRGENGEVRGTIQFSTEGQADYKYMLSFRVLNNGEPRGGVFNIDPKIRVVGR